MPVPMPSEILPKIARGPMANINEAETKPSTKLEPLLLLNLRFKFSPRFSSRSSICKTVPTNAPISNEKIITMITQPLGIALVNSLSQ